jgi:predicted nucleic acid-binding protein
MDKLLDTNILIGCLRKFPAYVKLFEELSVSYSLYISVITRLEIFAGAHPNEREGTTQFLSIFNSISVDDSIADFAGRYIYEYRRKGVTLNPPDAIIAATAISSGLELITTNKKHFPIEEINVYEFKPTSTR